MGCQLGETKFFGAMYDAHIQWLEGFGYRTCGALGPKAIVTGLDLRHIDLEHIDLEGIVYNDHTQWPENFSVYDVENAICLEDEKDVRGLDLRGANLNSTDFRECDLSEFDLSGANLSEADFSEANLEGADLTNAFYTSETTWPEGFYPEAAGAVLVED